MAYVLRKPQGTKQCSLCPSYTFIPELTKHLVGVHHKELQEAKALNKSETVAQNAVVRVVYADHLHKHAPPSFGEDAIYTGADVQNILQMYGHQVVMNKAWPRQPVTAVAPRLPELSMPESLPSTDSGEVTVESQPSTSRGVDALSKPADPPAYEDQTAVSSKDRDMVRGIMNLRTVLGLDIFDIEAAPSALPRACSSLSSRSEDDLTEADCLHNLKDLALKTFSVAHDKDIPKQDSVLAAFLDVREFQQLGGVDAKGGLTPGGKVVIKKVTSYMRDLRLHRYAQHFVDCTRHSKTSTKAQLVQILPKQYPELKNVTAKVQMIASYIVSLTRCFVHPSRSSNVLSLSSDPARLRNAITSNTWIGLMKKGPLPSRGNGIFAQQKHAKGQVVIDNGGKHLSGRDGDAKYASSSDGGMGYMIKFRFDDKWHYRDATEDDGHFGRLINHSACCSNVKGNPVDLFSDGRPVVIYTAKKVILPGDEILFDYNDSQSTADFLKKCSVCQGDPLRNNAIVQQPDNQPPKKRRKRDI